VHAVISIGPSDMSGPRVSVISVLQDNHGSNQPEKIDAWATHECETPEECPHEIEDLLDFSSEIGESRLERQLTDAYDALEKCVDIWIRVDTILPSATIRYPCSGTLLSQLEAGR
jgi:hypothetical protein